MDIDLPEDQPISAWEPAVRALEPRITRAVFAGMTGAAARLAASSCSFAWTATDVEVDEAGGLSGLPRLGFRAIPVVGSPSTDLSLARRLRGLLVRGVPLVWYGGASAGLLTLTGEDRELALQELLGPAQFRGAESPGRALLEDAGTSRLYIVRRVAGRMGSRRRRLVLALADWAAESLQPMRPCLCADGRIGRQGVGIASYEVLADRIGGNVARDDYSALRRRVGRWLAARRSAAAFLRGVARTSRAAFANRLRWAAESCEDEIELALGPLSERLAGGGGCGPAAEPIMRLLSEGRASAERAARWVLEAALIGSAVSASLRAALLDEPLAPLTGADLQDVIYLARAGAGPFRRLAARRLAGSDQPQAVDTLAQLAYSEDPGIAQAALGALTLPGNELRSRALADMLGGLTASPDRADGSRRAAVLLALSVTAGSIPSDLAAAAMESDNALVASAARSIARGTSPG